jgi:4-hydroxybenzoate polyprenyltransferase
MRTLTRPLVTGEMSTRFTLLFICATAVIFVAACALMNPLCLMLSPLALGLSAFYSFCKRFTRWCHFVLGTVLGLAPVAGWLSVDPVLTLPAVLLFLGVTFWVAGFDILYACQDAEFDLSRGLHSMPSRLGLACALEVSTMSHVVTGLFFILAGWSAGLSFVYFCVALAVWLTLLYEHRLVRADDLSRVNVAFFTLNGLVAVALFLGVVLDLSLLG